MVDELRVQELITGMNAFGKKEYHKSELLGEMLKLQDEVVDLTFGNRKPDTTRKLRLHEACDYLWHLNNENGHVVDEQLKDFVEESKELGNLIAAEVSGTKGEQKAFYKLDYLHVKNVVLRNVELENNGMRTEIDAVVITPKCVTIVEVKNTAKNIFIDEYGNYYRTGQYLNHDSNIASKLAIKEELLRKTLSNLGYQNIRIQKIVVFTNDRIEVQNLYSGIRTCFASQLTCIIDGYKGEDLYDEDAMAHMKEGIEASECRQFYFANFDVERFKRDFTTILVTLEEAIEKKTNGENVKKVSVRNLVRSIFASKFVRFASGIAVGFALAAISGNVIF